MKKPVILPVIIVAVLLCIVQLGLIQYFLTTLVPLGSDIWGYSWADIKQTVVASGGIKLFQISGFIIVSALIVWAFLKLPRKVNISFFYSLLLFALFIIFQKINIAKATSEWKINSEYSNNLSADKSYFFYSESYKHFFPVDDAIHLYADSIIIKNIINSTGKYGNENNINRTRQ